jgi:hypothetical protein
MFQDRRNQTDRRLRFDPTGIPPGGCRRRSDRRNRLRKYQGTPWWLQASYAEEVDPPVLEADGEANAVDGTDPVGHR